MASFDEFNRAGILLLIESIENRASSQSSAGCTRKLGCTCEDCINDGVPLNVDLTAVPYQPHKAKFKEVSLPFLVLYSAAATTTI